MEILLKLRRLSGWMQLLICLLCLGITMLFGNWLLGLFDYQATAFLLLFVLSMLAALFDRWPILAATFFSALCWNFFFIPPTFNFHINSDTDFLIFLTFFMIAFFNLLLSYRLREIDRKEQERMEQEKAIRLYNTILQTLSHELRTPITAILGSLDTIKELQGRLSETQVEELTANMQISALRLNDQVSKLLSMSRLEGGSVKVNNDWTDVEELIALVIRKNEDLWPDRKFDSQISEELPLAKLDASLMYTILFNLLQNAHVYSPSGKSIRILVSIMDEQLVIAVENEGKTIPESSLSLLFDMFYRLPQSPSGGTGLGLSIVKGLTEVQGGKIVVSQSEGCIRFELRLACELSWIKSLKHE